MSDLLARFVATASWPDILTLLGLLVLGAFSVYFVIRDFRREIKKPEQARQRRLDRLYGRDKPDND